VTARTVVPDTPADGDTRPRWTWQWLLLLALMLAVLETVSRVEDRIANGIPFGSRVISPNDLVWLHPGGARGRPGARYQQWALNSLGFRGPELSTVPAPGTARVVVVGASETFGLYESRGREYPRQLEDSLRARAASGCAAHATGVEVANAALPGMATPSMVRLLDQVVRKVRPDVVVLYPSPGFYLNAYPPRASVGPSGADSTLPARNTLTPRVVNRATRQIKALVPEPVKALARRIVVGRRNRDAGAPRFTGVPADRIAQFESDLREAVGVARSIRVPVLLMVHANATMEPGFSNAGLLESWVYQFPRATAETLVRFHQRAGDLERRIARDSGIVIVDLPSALHGHWRSAFADFVHFTDHGSAVVASALADAVWPLVNCRP